MNDEDDEQQVSNSNSKPADTILLKYISLLSSSSVVSSTHPNQIQKRTTQHMLTALYASFLSQGLGMRTYAEYLALLGLEVAGVERLKALNFWGESGGFPVPFGRDNAGMRSAAEERRIKEEREEISRTIVGLVVKSCLEVCDKLFICQSFIVHIFLNFAYAGITDPPRSPTHAFIFGTFGKHRFIFSAVSNST